MKTYTSGDKKKSYREIYTKKIQEQENLSKVISTMPLVKTLFSHLCYLVAVLVIKICWGADITGNS